MIKIAPVLFMLFGFYNSLEAQTVAMKIHVTQVQRGKGNVSLALYDQEAHFLKTACLNRTLAASSEQLTFTVEVPPGNYAIAIFQDLDGNGALKENWVGIPVEPVGFGNNYRPLFRGPRFRDCAVPVSKAQTDFYIQLFRIL